MKYRNNHKPQMKVNTIMAGIILVIILTVCGIQSIISHNHINIHCLICEAQAPRQAFAYMPPTPTPTPTIVPVPDAPQIKSYIHTIFEQDADMAIAVFTGECHFQPKCENISNIEYSIGLAQINIRAHYNQIPGSTLADKSLWLKNPYNNVLMAYWIFQKSGWTPWTAYTNGSYKNYL